MDIESVRPLLKVVEVAATSQQSIVKIGLSVGLIPPAAAACIVLLVGRFEQFLKDQGNRALEHYGMATPPIHRINLPHEMQLGVLVGNLNSALRKADHGVPIPAVTRIASLDSVANRIADGEVWGDNAIDTKSNPNSAVVKEIMTLAGVAGPWAKIEQEFQPIWGAIAGSNPGFKAIPSAQQELESWITHRHSIAHSNALPTVGPHELSEMMEFFSSLGEAIDNVLQSTVSAAISGHGSAMSAW
ncbi:hypothetical protein HQQ88_05590 [Curtobacterium sp. VKM Ac-2861]|uniref:HEPN domain-containing protein n=1 Tax=Curtobacterium sp. VKM Ac-2861 TaxID=2739016 RepID=UPI0015632B61|nr:hypothetical protein [Curtobacterium sp. VKM Ac-2861]